MSSMVDIFSSPPSGLNKDPSSILELYTNQISSSPPQIFTPPPSSSSLGVKTAGYQFSLTPESTFSPYPEIKSNQTYSPFTAPFKIPHNNTRSTSAASRILNQSNYKDDSKFTNILGSIASLLIQQSELLQNHEDQFNSFSVGINDRMDDLENKISEMTDILQREEKELEVYLKVKLEEVMDRFDHLLVGKDGLKKRIKGRSKKFDNLTFNTKSISKLDPRNIKIPGNVLPNNPNYNTDQNISPTTSEIMVEDLINFDDLPIESMDIQDQAWNQYQSLYELSITPYELSVTPFDTSPSDQSNMINGESSQAVPNGTLVDQAIEKQRLLLNGENVLQEGQNTVDFMFRKRLKGNKSKDNFKIDMSFLDDISIDNQESNDAYEPSNLSSGIDSLPPTFTKNSPAPAGPSTNTRSTVKQPWNPFPLTYMREPTRSSSLPSSASSDISHLTSVKRGASLVDDKLLLPGRETPSGFNKNKRKKSRNMGWSNKKKKVDKGGNGWPCFGQNTIKSRMEEITCDTCGGKAHWACAGLSHGKDMRGTPWSCPDCLAILIEADDDEDGRVPSIPRAQQERCLRPNCIYRSAKKIIRKNADVDQFYMERIIGRKRLHYNYNGGGGATYMYLIKWWDWEIYDSTWEPHTNIDKLEYYETLFFETIKKNQGPDIYTQKVLLAEECEPWFDHKGNYNIELLTSLGVEKRVWWYD